MVDLLKTIVVEEAIESAFRAEMEGADLILVGPAITTMLFLKYKDALLSLHGPNDGFKFMGHNLVCSSRLSGYEVEKYKLISDKQ